MYILFAVLAYQNIKHSDYTYCLYPVYDLIIHSLLACCRGDTYSFLLSRWCCCGEDVFTGQKSAEAGCGESGICLPIPYSWSRWVAWFWFMTIFVVQILMWVKCETALGIVDLCAGISILSIIITTTIYYYHYYCLLLAFVDWIITTTYYRTSSDDRVQKGGRIARWWTAWPRTKMSAVQVSATASCCGGELFTYI